MKTFHIFSNMVGKTLFLPALMVMLALTTSLAQAPANDPCSGATPIACGQTVTGSTLNATIDQAPACGLSLPKYGVWYSIVGTGGDITLSTCGGTTNYDTQIGVYSGSCAALTCVAGNNNFCGRQSTVTFTSASGTTYYIWVTGVIDARGNFSLSATCAVVAAPNDACANATAITCGQTVSGSTIGATTDAVSTCGTTLNTAGGVWYSIVGNGAAITVSTCNPGTNYDTKMGVFSGTCGALVCVGGNDDTTAPECVLPATGFNRKSRVTFNSVSGTTYYILVTGFSTLTGSFELSATCATPPPPPPPANNDNCADATLIACGGTASGTTVGATLDGPATQCFVSGLSVAPDRWYKVVGNGQSMTVGLCTSSYDTKIDVYSGTCGALVCVGYDDDACTTPNAAGSLETWSSVNGTTYYIRVHGFSGATGTYTLTLDCTTPILSAPANTTAELAGEVVGLPEGALTVGQVFPNPMVGSTASIRVDSPKETEAIVRFMDQMGREVMMIESDLNVGDNLLQLNISRLPAGTYFVMVQVEGKVIPRRLVVPRS